jgi:cytochrome b561
MQLRNSADRYGAIARCLHWCTVVLVIVAWALGTFDDTLPKGVARAAGLFVHISAGLAICAILVARVPWRMVDPPLPVESTMLGEWSVRMSRLAHYALYALLVATPIAGIVLQFARGDALPLLGFAEIPSPWVANRAVARFVKETHEVAANTLIGLAVLHATAALVHHWVLRDQTLVRMLPGSRHHGRRRV